MKSDTRIYEDALQAKRLEERIAERSEEIKRSRAILEFLGWELISGNSLYFKFWHAEDEHEVDFPTELLEDHRKLVMHLLTTERQSATIIARAQLQDEIKRLLGLTIFTERSDRK